MAGFKFRLQTLEKLRRRSRDQAATALGEVRAAQQIIADQIAQIENEHRDLDEVRRRSAVGTVDLQMLTNVQRYQLQLDGQKQYLEQQAKTLQVEHDRRRDLLTDAEKELKVLEKLREKQHSQWTEEQLAREQKMLDEFGSRGLITAEARRVASNGEG